MTTAVHVAPVLDLAAEQLVAEVDAASTPTAFRDWQASVRTLIRGAPSADPLIVTVPTVWGTPRTARLERALAVPGRPTALVPRAIAIARSHTDVACSVCVVVETLDAGRSPGRNPVAHRLARGARGWELGVTCELDRTSDTWPADLDDAAAVFIDESATDDVVEWVRRHASAGRVLGVDTELVRDYGADPGVAERSLDAAEVWLGERPVSGHPRRKRALAVATVATVIAAVAVVIGIRSAQPLPGAQAAVVGRVTVDVPAGWQRAELSSGRTDGRAVFVHRDDGRRIIVVQTTVRAGSTPASVARSLANKIAQRGDDAVAEFAPSMRVGGRDVIAYRETPASGSAIAWYVVVERDLQVSIGCQGGSAAESVQTECLAAVASAAIR